MRRHSRSICVPRSVISDLCCVPAGNLCVVYWDNYISSTHKTHFKFKSSEDSCGHFRRNKKFRHAWLRSGETCMFSLRLSPVSSEVTSLRITIAGESLIGCTLASFRTMFSKPWCIPFNLVNRALKWVDHRPSDLSSFLRRSNSLNEVNLTQIRGCIRK